MTPVVLGDISAVNTLECAHCRQLVLARAPSARFFPHTMTIRPNHSQFLTAVDRARIEIQHGAALHDFFVVVVGKSRTLLQSLLEAPTKDIWTQTRSSSARTRRTKQCHSWVRKKTCHRRSQAVSGWVKTNTLISGLRRYVLPARSCGADLENRQGVLRTLECAHRI